MADLQSKEIVKIVCAALEEKKAGDLKIIEIDEVSPIADYFVICDGANAPQVEALVDNVGRRCFEENRGHEELRLDIDGLRRCRRTRLFKAGQTVLRSRKSMERRKNSFHFRYFMIK